MLGEQERFVALDVDVDIGGMDLGDGVHAVGAAGELGAGEDGWPALCVAEVHDLVRVGGDEDLVELGAGARGFVDPGEHGAAGDFAENLARETGGGETSGDDGESAGWVHAWVRGLTLIGGGLRIDRAALGRVSHLGDAVQGAAFLISFTPRRCSSDG